MHHSDTNVSNSINMGHVPSLFSKDSLQFQDTVSKRIIMHPLASLLKKTQFLHVQNKADNVSLYSFKPCFT